MHQSWFKTVFGFEESTYSATRDSFRLDGTRLMAIPSGRQFEAGTFTLPSLAELRQRTAPLRVKGNASRLSVVVGNVAELHQQAEHAGAMFQVASQLNALEMTGPSVTPEDGLTRYEYDRTQGPACAMAAPAALVARQFFVNGGQGGGNQINAASGLESALGVDLGVRNGYALPDARTLAHVSELLAGLNEAGRDALLGTLRIGLHSDVGVTGAGHLVSQALASAVPVAYSRHATGAWEPLARLVLDSAYEMTLLAAALTERRLVVLTLLGGGAFGNQHEWIEAAIERAVVLTRPLGLDIRINCFRPDARIERLTHRLA